MRGLQYLRSVRSLVGAWWEANVNQLMQCLMLTTGGHSIPGHVRDVLLH